MKLKILIIDDDQVNNFVLKNVIQRSYKDVQVDVKLEGQSALNYLETLDNRSEHFPDIILLDVYMPIMNGYQFLDIFHEKYGDRDTHIFMVSTSLSKEDQQKANSYPMVFGYVTKPIINHNIHFIVESLGQKGNRG